VTGAESRRMWRTVAITCGVATVAFVAVMVAGGAYVIAASNS